MKQFLIFSLIFHCFWAYSQTTVPKWGQDRLEQLKAKYLLESYIKPNFLESDFSGDKVGDIAILIRRKMDNKKGIVIFFGKRTDQVIIGAGNKFGAGGDNFNWANLWSIFDKKETYETTFLKNGDIDGSRKVFLKWSGISIRQEEGSGGLIYFDGVKFIWIHQGD